MRHCKAVLSVLLAFANSEQRSVRVAACARMWAHYLPSWHRDTGGGRKQSMLPPAASSCAWNAVRRREVERKSSEAIKRINGNGGKKGIRGKEGWRSTT